MIPLILLVARLIAGAVHGAENPARFTTVTNWQATFTRTLQSSGTHTGPDQCTYKWSFGHSATLSSTYVGFLLAGGWSDVFDTNKTFTFSIQDRGTQTCPNADPTTYEASAGPAMILVQGMNLRINLAQTNYALEGTYLVGPYSGTVDGDPFPGSAVAWFPPSTNVITEPLPDSGMVISGSRTYALSELDFFALAPVLTIASSGSPLGVGGKLTGQLVVTWDFRPAVEEVEVVVEPDDYETWLPKGNLENPEQFGNYMIVRAKLQTPDGNPPQIARAQSFKFELADISKEPGICLNFPSESPSSSPDFKFEQTLNNLLGAPPVNVISETVAQVGDPDAAPDILRDTAAAAAVVSSFDFGGYGTVKVTARVHGKDILGYLKIDPEKRREPIRLPKRKENSHIADEWKKNFSQLPDDDDEENDPVGDQHRGDGYSLYQEYRGFSENREHKRLDAKKKDLFILDTIGDGFTEQEITLFARSSGLKVHYELREDEMPASNVMNVNHGTENHLHDQAGLRMVLSPQHLGYSESEVRQGHQANSTPGAHPRILVDSAFQHPGIPEYNAIAHELAHGCSVWHHGDRDPGAKSLQSSIYGGLGIVSEFNGAPIFLHNEDDTPVTTQISSPKIYAAVPNGQHSGNQDCLMRYKAARLFSHKELVTRTNTITGDLESRYVFYFIPTAEPNARRFLCESPAGTGINLPKAGTVWPRHYDADAAENRGNCKSQICVNDRYVRDSKHQR